MEEVRLNEYSKEEWRYWITHWNPDMTQEAFEAAWEDFVLLKKLKQLQ